MSKPIFIINGSGKVGKDTFIYFVAEHNKNIYHKGTLNYSSIDKVKEIAKIIGWGGGKSEKDRKFLYDLKQLCINYNDLPLQSMAKIVDEYNKEDYINLCFLHIREPEEIEKAKNYFKTNKVYTLLITNDKIQQIKSNGADGKVFNYQYDIIIENNGTLEDLNKQAKDFINKFLF